MHEAREKPRVSLRAHAQCSHAPPPCAAPRVRTALPCAPLRAPLRAHARRLARTRAPPRARAQRCRSADVPVRALRAAARACGERSATARASDGRDSVISTHPSHNATPTSFLCQGWLAEGDAVPGGLLDLRILGQHLRLMVWLAHVGPLLLARPAAAAGTAGPRRLPARLARGGCRHGRP